MRNIILLFIACTLLLCTGGNISGTVSDTDTGKAAMVYNPDLTPAVNASVKFFEVNDTTRTPALQTVTDVNGRYTFAGLAKGTYNILAKKDSALAFQDSVFISSTVNSITPDTLGKSGTVTCLVRLQINHDPRTVFVQVLGTDIYCNVDSMGNFTLKSMAKGEYRIRLTTTLPDYSPLFSPITVRSATNDTLHDTLILPYTGIPVVTVINASYDTLNGTVHLNWNKAAYRNLQDYIIYKDYYNTVNLSTTPFAAANDTLFTDTIFSRKLISGPCSFSDTNDYNFKYRVAVRSNVNMVGQTYKNINIIAISPVKVKTELTFLSYSKSDKILTGVIRINDTVSIVCHAINHSRLINKISWIDADKKVLLKSVTVNLASNLITDTLKYYWNETGVKNIECIVTDLANVEYRDTVVFNIIDDTPVVTFPDSIIYAGTPFKLNADIQMQYGKVKKLEWDIGNTGTFTEVSKADTTIYIADTFFSSDYQCVLRVTDDNMTVVKDTLHLKSWLIWEKVAQPFSDNGQIVSCYIFNNKAFVIEEDYASRKYHLLMSGNGIEWTCIKDSMPFKYPSSASLISFRDTLWIIQNQYMNYPYPASGDSSWLWSSVDGLNWNNNGLLEAYDTSNYNKNIWTNTTAANFRIHSNIIYGLCIDVGMSNYVVTTSDMRMWNKFYPSPKHDNQSLEIFNDQLWSLSRISNVNEEILHSYFSNDLKSSAVKDIYGLPNNNLLICTSNFKNHLMVHFNNNTVYDSKDGIEWYQCSNTLPTLSSTQSFCFEFNSYLFCIIKDGVWMAH